MAVTLYCMKTQKTQTLKIKRPGPEGANDASWDPLSYVW